MNGFKLGLAALAVMLAVVSGGARSAMAAESGKTPERMISVTATGSVAADPDIAYITTGVVTEAATAREALSQNNQSMAKVVDGLKAAGIAAKDIQTTAVNLEPRYQHNQDGRAPKLIGYRVSNHVRITARDLKRLGEVLDQVVTLGANQVGGIAYEVSNAEQLKDEARKAAMANALRRARLYASAAGATIGHVLTISEEVSHMPGRGVMTRSALAAEAVPIEAGTQRLDVQVHVSWALQ
jgi:uncharacterized protein